jgi:hypothetical protein
VSKLLICLNQKLMTKDAHRADLLYSQTSGVRKNSPGMNKRSMNIQYNKIMQI